jgi:3-hydroxybutyryl-CoA dehydrogenase
MKYKNIVVAGGGVLGSQIAFQCAYCGFNVTVLIPNEEARKALNDKIKNLRSVYTKTIKVMNTKAGKAPGLWARGIADINHHNLNKCLNRVKSLEVKTEIDQAKALENADLLIESITEIFDVKKEFYQQVAPLLPEKTVIVTNSSTLLPSKLAKFTGRPEKYLAMHFANSIWMNNIAEIMKHSDTDTKYFKEIIKFAEAINMVPLAAKEEKAGYLLNSLLVPFLLCAMDMYANGISDPETIDKAWTLGTGAPHGPFKILDTVGLETAKNIVLQYQKVPNLLDPLFKKMMLPYNYDGMLDILNDYIAKGKTGKAAGEGFYKHDKKK